ncbi:MAG: lytic transglycosylase domain-containing protein [Betaproteobacteria bacterium]|nr:lytic transglycosylase domain-containing protein [Betaproteobacteria bacterium]
MGFFADTAGARRWLLKSGLSFVSMWTLQAQAIDFKVEFPPQEGVLSPEDSMFFDDALAVSESQSDSPYLRGDKRMNPELPSLEPQKKAGGTAVQNRVPPPKLPEAEKEQALQRVVAEPVGASARGFEQTKANGTSTIALTARGAFPNLSCLNDNVSFWKRVYAEVDTHEALIHDRDELDKVYASVRLGGSERQRQQSIRMLKEHYQTSIRSLAEKVSAPKSWNPTERTIAKIFKPSELTRSRLLRAADNVRLQQGLKSRFNSGVQRSLQYLPTIKTIIRQQRLPLDIAYLPHVESSFVNHAKSKVGAVGLWQIMPSTMQLLMGKNAVSKRTEPQTATQAATKLLKQNYQATGSWPLALTAYNHGLGGVLRAIRHTGSNDLCKIIERYNSPSFRFASSNFYAQFLAARQIALQRYAELSKNREVGPIVAPLLASRDKGAL